MQTNAEHRWRLMTNEIKRRPLPINAIGQTRLTLPQKQLTWLVRKKTFPLTILVVNDNPIKFLCKRRAGYIKSSLIQQTKQKRSH